MTVLLLSLALEAGYSTPLGLGFFTCEMRVITVWTLWATVRIKPVDT